MKYYCSRYKGSGDIGDEYLNYFCGHFISVVKRELLFHILAKAISMTARDFHVSRPSQIRTNSKPPRSKTARVTLFLDNKAVRGHSHGNDNGNGKAQHSLRYQVTAWYSTPRSLEDRC